MFGCRAMGLGRQPVQFGRSSVFLVHRVSS
jgi:hypothetical protein